jgi:hypothetical protein
MTPALPNFSRLPSMQAVTTPHGVRHLATVLVALSATLAFALVIAPWQQTAAGKGRVIAYAPLDRQQALEAPLEGRVTRWYVQEGSRGRRGARRGRARTPPPASRTPRRASATSWIRRGGRRLWRAHLGDVAILTHPNRSDRL